MRVDEVVAVLDSALQNLSSHRETLRDLDAAVGDGDLGITVDKGSEAIRQALKENPPETVGALLRSAGAAFAKANPSTMAALVGAGLLAASKEVGDASEWDDALAERVGRAAMARIAERGKAELGDKTVLDALAPSLDALRDNKNDALTAMVAAAEKGVEETRDQAGRRGRAAWVGERGSGHPDPGATAYVLFLKSLQSALS
ncbi:MAG: DAK2 domain-containing protein [Actinomycetales bacterium]